MKTTLGGVELGSVDARRGLQYSLADGILWQIMLGLVDTFAVAAALSLHATPLSISLLAALPPLAGAAAQITALYFVKPSQPRKGYVVASLRMQATCILGAAFSGFLPAPWNTGVFVTAIVCYGTAGMLYAPLWTTWYSDLVPDNVIGRHSAWRNRYLAITALIVSLVVGVMARKYTSATAPWTFYTIIFCIAALMRLGGSMFVSMQYEPPRSRPYAPPSLRKFKPPRALIIFAIAMAMLNGAAGMAGPYFNVYWLRDLHFSYLTLTLVNSTFTIGSMIALPWWGRLIDRLGPLPALRLAAFMAACIPLPYLFHLNAPAISVINFFSGVAWSGVGVCSFKVLLRIAGADRPEQSLWLCNIIQGVSGLVFGLTGAWFATHLPDFFGNRLQSLFVLSGIMRLVIVMALFNRFRELAEGKEAGVSLRAFLASRVELLLDPGRSKQ